MRDDAVDVMLRRILAVVGRCMSCGGHAVVRHRHRPATARRAGRRSRPRPWSALTRPAAPWECRDPCPRSPLRRASAHSGGACRPAPGSRSAGPSGWKNRGLPPSRWRIPRSPPSMSADAAAARAWAAPRCRRRKMRPKVKRGCVQLQDDLDGLAKALGALFRRYAESVELDGAKRGRRPVDAAPTACRAAPLRPAATDDRARP